MGANMDVEKQVTQLFQNFMEQNVEKVGKEVDFEEFELDVFEDDEEEQAVEDVQKEVVEWVEEKAAVVEIEEDIYFFDHVKVVHKSKVKNFLGDRSVRCKYKSTSREVLMKHKEFFHKEKPKKDKESAELKRQEEFPCDHCGRVFEVEWKLKRHQNNKEHSTGLEELNVNCEKCERVYKTKLSMRQHMRLKHQEDGSIFVFKCDNCDKLYNSKAGMRQHMKTKHLGAGKGMRMPGYFKCQLCGKLYSHMSSMWVHTRKEHTDSVLKEL